MDLTFLDAAELILDQNDNKPMTAREIWNEIVRQNLVTWSGKTPESGSLPQMMSRQPNRFNRSSDSPAKFSINYSGKVDLDVDDSDTEEIDTEDNEDVSPLKNLMLQDFWDKFKLEINKVSNYYLRVNPRGVRYFAAATGIGSIYFVCVVSSRFTRVEVYFNKVKEQNKLLFDYILSKTDKIESQFVDNLTFERMDNKRASRIKYEIPSNVYDKNTWDDIINFLKLNFVKLTDTFQPIFDEVKNDPSVLNSTLVSNEIENTPEEDILDSEREFSQNPFKQAICVLGKSGKGKSTTIDKMLDKMENTEFEFIIPTSSTTALLSQYSPSLNKYITSRLGKMIMNAYKNEKTYYIAVIDECHKSNVIEMINDELLQCISTYRNNRNRFISVDDETAELYKGLSLYRGNLLVPDNFGFIFLSSKPDVIIQNSDFFNRVDIYVMIKQPSKDADLSLLYTDEDRVELPSEYFTKISGKLESDIDRIKELNDAD